MFDTVVSFFPFPFPLCSPLFSGPLCASHAASPSRTLLGLPATFVLTFASIPPISPASKGQKAVPGARCRPWSAMAGRWGQTLEGAGPVACARQPLPPSACAQPRRSEMGLFKRIVQRLVQCLPPSGSRSWAALRFLAPLPTLSHGRTKTQKVLGRAGWVGDCQSRISSISLDTATAGLGPGRRAGGAGDAGEERTRGAPWPGSLRPRGEAQSPRRVRGRGAALRPLVPLPFPDPGSAAPRGNWRWRSGGGGAAGGAGVCVRGCVFVCVVGAPGVGREEGRGVQRGRGGRGGRAGGPNFGSGST